MKIIFYVFLSLFYLAPHTSYAIAKDDGEYLYRSIYDSLLGSGDNEKVSILINSKLVNPWSLRNAGARIAAKLSDDLIFPNWITKGSESSFSSSYTQTLMDVEWGRLPFSPAEEEEFSQLKGSLFVYQDGKMMPTASYSRFRALKANYDQVLQKWQNTAPQERTKELEKELDAARKAFETDQDAARIRPLDRRLRVLAGYDYAHFGRRARAKLDKYLVPGNKELHPEVMLYPQLDLFSGVPWRKFELSFDRVDKKPPYGFTPNLNNSWCCTSTGKSFSIDKPLQISFDAMQHAITRPWSDEDAFFGSGRKVWRFKQKDKTLADGKVAAGEEGTAPMTFISRSFIVTRNIAIRTSWSTDLLEGIRQACAGNGQIRLGPFAVAGRFQGVDGEQLLCPMPSADQTLLVPGGLQLIGFSSSMMPLAPDSRPDLIWQNPLPDLGLSSP